MLVEEELAGEYVERDTVVTIGVFDGVHLGHESLITRLNERAADGLMTVVVTFRRHPRLVLMPQSKITYLTSLKERVRLLENLGVNRVITLSFTPELARLDARDFIALLKKHIKMCSLVVGPDFALGRGRKGNAEVLKQLGDKLGFSVEVVQPLLLNGEVVSSTVIRTALSQGDMAKVRRLLGRDFSLEGEVVCGERRGGMLGFPTANLVPDPDQAIPPDGVYATRAFLEAAVYQSVTNIGVRPTFGGGRRLVEVHILDFPPRELYGSELRIELIERLRDEIKFSGMGELKAQMERDVIQARAVVASMGAGENRKDRQRI